MAHDANDSLQSGLSTLKKQREDDDFEQQKAFLRKLQKERYAASPPQAPPTDASAATPANAPSPSPAAGAAEAYTLTDVVKDTASIPIGAARDVAQAATDLCSSR